MANLAVTTLQLAAAISNGIALAQLASGAGFMTMNGALSTSGVATFDVARRVALSSTVNFSAVTFTITGTNRNGIVQSETLLGPNNTTVNSVRDYLTVTSIFLSAGGPGTIAAGTSVIGSSEWVVNNLFVSSWAMTFAAITAGTTYSVEFTLDDPNAAANSGVTGVAQFSNQPGSFSPPQVFPGPAAMTAATTAQIAAQLNPINAHRLTITSGTGSVTLWSLQSGIIS